MTEQQRQAVVKEKAVLLAGRKMADKYRWKIGDHIHLRSPNYHLSLDPVLRGNYILAR